MVVKVIPLILLLVFIVLTGTSCQNSIEPSTTGPIPSYSPSPSISPEITVSPPFPAATYAYLGPTPDPNAPQGKISSKTMHLKPILSFWPKSLI